jgi:hypothetical protein
VGGAAGGVSVGGAAGGVSVGGAAGGVSVGGAAGGVSVGGAAGGVSVGGAAGGVSVGGAAGGVSVGGVAGGTAGGVSVGGVAGGTAGGVSVGGTAGGVSVGGVPGGLDNPSCCSIEVISCSICPTSCMSELSDAMICAGVNCCELVDCASVVPRVWASPVPATVGVKSPVAVSEAVLSIPVPASAAGVSKPVAASGEPAGGIIEAPASADPPAVIGPFGASLDPVPRERKEAALCHSELLFCHEALPLCPSADSPLAPPLAFPSKRVMLGTCCVPVSEPPLDIQLKLSALSQACLDKLPPVALLSAVRSF